MTELLASRDPAVPGPGWPSARAHDLPAVPGRVDVWCAWTGTLSAAHADEIITEPERRWLDTVVAPRARAHRLFARAALRSILAGYLQVPVRRVALTRDEDGRPRLADGELKFSLSHTAGCVLIAVTLADAVGIDVERLRRAPNGPLHRYLSATEQRLLERAGRAQRDRVAVGLWTRKEAVAKATGRSLAEVAEVTLAPTGPDQPALVEVGGADVAVAPLRPDRDHVAALARQGPGRDVRCRTWTP